jgi:murein DD-endopeptidase MepM/ murein hydrolase activator NlpD
VRHARGVEEVTVIAPPPPRSMGGKLVGVGVGAVAVLVAIGSYTLRVPLPSTSLANINFDTSENLAIGSRLAEKEGEPPILDPRDEHPVPEVEGEKLDELYPSLLDWIHPVADTDEVVPTQSGGRFGAGRGGVDREECGNGHCGVDLFGPIGRPIVAVGDGVVVRVERSENGRDGKSGRYVRIEHSDGTLTSYMHLDTVEEGLQVRDRVDGGQQIGTLGASAIHSSAPHLHFALEIPNEHGDHGDHTNTHYVDPAPFLVRASVSHSPQRKHAIKPAF